MTARDAFLLSFVAGAVFVAAALWLFCDEARPARTPPPERVGGQATSTAARQDHPESMGRGLPARSEARDLAPARQGEALAGPGEARDGSDTPAPGGRRTKRLGDRSFDASRLAAIGFEPDDIAWIRERWKRAELERRELAALEDRGEQPPPGWDESAIQRELRADLGERGYDAVLYATHRHNRVLLDKLKNGGVAQRAGIGDGSVVWSYDGQRVFQPRELAKLSTAASPDEFAELVFETSEGIERRYVERGPLGADLLGTTRQPEP